MGENGGGQWERGLGVRRGGGETPGCWAGQWVRPLRIGGGGRERLLEGGGGQWERPPGTIGAHKGPPWDGARNETLGAGKAMGDPPDGGAGEGLWGTGGQEGSVGGGKGKGGFTCTALTTPPRRELPDTAVGQTVRVLPALHAGAGDARGSEGPRWQSEYRGLLWGPWGGWGGGLQSVSPSPPSFPPPSQVVLSRQYGSEGRFTFTSHTPGEHQICLHSNSTRMALFAGGKLVTWGGRGGDTQHPEVLTAAFARRGSIWTSRWANTPTITPRSQRRTN